MPNWYSRCCRWLPGALVLAVMLAASMPAAGEESLTMLGACDPTLESLFLEDVGKAREAAEELAGSKPEDPFCAAAVGELYLLQKNMFWAVSSLQRANELFKEQGNVTSPPAQRARLLLCIALAASEQWETAIEICDESGVDEVDLAAAFSYYRGIAAFRAGDEKLALRLLDGPLVAALDQRFRETAVAFRDLAAGRLIGIEPGLKLSTSSGFGYDSNALMAPEDAASVGLDDDVGSWRAIFWASLGYAPKNIGKYQISGAASFFRSFHTTETAQALNTTDITASAGLQRFGPSDKGKWAAGVRYGYRLVLLDGGGTTVDDNLFAFMESHTVSIGPNWLFDSGTSVSVRYGFSYQRFAELVRNAQHHNLSIGESFRLTDKLSLTLAQSASLAQSTDAYSRYGFALGTVLAWAPSSLWTGIIRGTVQFENYYTSGGYFGDESRLDLPYFARAEIHLKIGAGFVAGLYGGVSGRVSSIETLDFFKWEGGVLLDWSLGGIQ